MLKSFKKGEDRSTVVVIDCRTELPLEQTINSLRSIFGSLPKSTKYYFRVNKEGTGLFRPVLNSLYSQAYKEDPTNCREFVEGPGIEQIISDELKKLSCSYYCFLKLGIVVSPTFLNKLIFGFDNFKDYYESGKPGIVLPVFNGKVGNQHLVLPPELKAEDLQAVNNKLIDVFASGQKTRWIVTGLATNVCYVLSKAVVEKCGFPDESLEKEFDGTTMITQYLVRLLEDNFVGVVCGDTYVYIPEPEKHCAPSSQFIFTEAIEEHTLGVLYKIHLRTEFQLSIFEQSLLKMVTIADKIYIKDCSSSVKVATYMKEKYPKVWEKVSYEKYFQATDDKRDYNAMLDLAEADGCDWVLSLEGNESFGDDVDRSTFDRLMNPPHNTIFGYALPEFYMWDEENWRMDGIWLNSSSVRLARLFPGRRILHSSNLATQSGYVPVLPKEFIRLSNLMLQIWSFSSSAERQEAYKYVTSADTQNDYRYFLDEKTLQLYPMKYKEVSTYSPCAIGGQKLFDWLEHIWSWSDVILLGNDRNQIPEASLEVAKKYFNAVVVPCSMEKNFAEGRNQVIAKADTDFIFQLDLDERIIDPRVLVL